MNARDKTTEHIKMVGEFLDKFVSALYERAISHDSSKLDSPEAETFEKFTPLLANTTYGSDEYKQFLKDMKPALDHHYENNRHHPEHFENGINGMTLVDLVEMFCDWQAAVKRHDDGNILNSIEINSKRFEMSDQLKQIFINTIEGI